VPGVSWIRGGDPPAPSAEEQPSGPADGSAAPVFSVPSASRPSGPSAGEVDSDTP
jgi:hypothetical protein